MTFDHIYHTYYRELIQFATVLTNCQYQAGEMVQEAYVRLFETMQKGIVIHTPRAWLYKTVKNRCINFKNRTRFITNVDQNQEPAASHSDFEESQLLEERTNQLKRTIANLSKQEQILLFLYKKQLSYKEIADVLKMNPNSVGKTLSRVIEKVANKIKETNHELFEA